MSQLDKLLAECTEIASATSKLSKETPIIKKKFQECQKLVEDINILAKKHSKELDEIFTRKTAQLTKIMIKIDQSIQRYEDASAVIKKDGDMLDTLQVHINKISILEEKVANMEQLLHNGILSIISEQYEPDSLLGIIVENNFQFPLAVQRDTWTPDFYFVVQYIQNNKAVGTTYKENQEHSKKCYSLTDTKFSLYLKE